MGVDLRETVDRLRRPEHTGENRCGLCTVLNLGIAACVSVGITVVGLASVGPLPAFVAGAAGFSVFVAAIYLRGYLVPKTPTLTERYGPEWFLQFFESKPVEPARTEEGNVDAAAMLERADALTECEHEDDVCLTDGFQSAWWRRIHQVRDANMAREELSVVLGADPETMSYDTHGDAFVVFCNGDLIGRWESYGAFVADIAAGNELESRGQGWTRLSVRQRSMILQRLRAFLEACPMCEERLSAGQEVIRSCCRSTDVIAIECEGCGARVFEAEQHPDSAR